MSGSTNSLPLSFNRLAFIALVGSAGVAFLALFSFPWLAGLGLSFQTSFILVSAVEFVTAIICALAVNKLYIQRDD